MVIFRESVLDMTNQAIINRMAEENRRQRRESIRRGDISLRNFDFSGLIWLFGFYSRVDSYSNQYNYNFRRHHPYQSYS